MLNKNKKLILKTLIGAVLVLILFLAPEESRAWPNIISDVAAKAVMTFLGWIGYILGYIAGIFLMIATFLIDLALNVNSTLVSSITVQTGWKITLSIANLGFVLAIIVIAFATIFRQESYAMKQTLWKLIVAALLVNFSLVIAGGFLSISDIFTNYFIDAGGFKNPATWANAIVGMLGTQNFVDVGQEADVATEITKASGITNNFGLKFVVSLMFIAVFTAIAVVTLLAIAAMLLVRYVFLGILLILSPIVWLLWIFPATKEHWKKWWDNFLRWTFFAPIMMFFIYLALFAMNPYGETSGSSIKDHAKTAAREYENQGLPLTFGLDSIGNFAIVLGLLFGGLIAANQLGIAGAGIASAVAKTTSKNLANWTGRLPLKGAAWMSRPSNRMLNWATDPKAGKTKQWIGSKIHGMQSRLSAIPGFKQLGKYKPPKEYATFWGSVWGGMKDGSGLFKKKKPKYTLTPEGKLQEEPEEEKKPEKKETKKT